MSFAAASLLSVRHTSPRASFRCGSMRHSALAAAALITFGTAPRTTALSGPGRNMSASASPLAGIRLTNSWVRRLSPETEENLRRSRERERIPASDASNRRRRPIFNGHYVDVRPTGLREPELVLLSEDVAKNVLKMTQEQLDSDDFVQWVSGNRLDSEPLKSSPTWATPYALSIMGKRYTSNCPYGTGDGYGDGRAISIAELSVGQELQLKGAGPTPFHRGADGRAVLRSSIREFVASEAMHWLGIDTTRALSLVVSKQDTVQRPWYSDDAVLRIPSMDDPRLSQYSPAQRKALINQLKSNQKMDPNIMIVEPCAITCRVAPSFSRVGHVDLFARRVGKEKMTASSGKYDTESLAWKEYSQLIWHVCYREYKEDAYDPYFDENDISAASRVLLEKSAIGIATMVGHWLRVGFAQGNFNADNCLVAGRTMDYGPFGYLEEFTPLFAKWTGSGQHFGFLNQPNAGLANYQVLVESVAPAIVMAEAGAEETADELDERESKLIEELMTRAQSVFRGQVDETFRAKLGLPKDADAGDALWETLYQDLFTKSRTDWTIFWRQLTYVARDFETDSKDYAGMLATLEQAESFYEPLSADIQEEWKVWLEQWRDVLEASGVSSQDAFAQMSQQNPKIVPREWMLVEAYDAAGRGNFEELHELYEALQNPYSSDAPSKYYRQAPASALAKGGTAFMS